MSVARTTRSCTSTGSTDFVVFSEAIFSSSQKCPWWLSHLLPTKLSKNTSTLTFRILTADDVMPFMQFFFDFGDYYTKWAFRKRVVMNLLNRLIFSSREFMSVLCGVRMFCARQVLECYCKLPVRVHACVCV